MGKDLNNKQLEFLKKVKEIGVNNIIDTTKIWELSKLSVHESNIITEKELHDLQNLQKQHNPGNIYEANSPVICTWRKEYMAKWVTKWLYTGEYFENNNDGRILNSLGRYYRRYKLRTRNETSST